MLRTGTERIEQEILAMTEKYGRERDALIPILQDIQRRYSHVSEHAMQVVADALGIHPVEVHSVMSFYSFLDARPKGRFVIRLCRTISCDLQGKDGIARQLENDLGIKFGQTTRDGMFTLEWANCLGMCDQGPALLVNDKIYPKVAPHMVSEIIAECRGLFGLHALQHEEGH